MKKNKCLKLTGLFIALCFLVLAACPGKVTGYAATVSASWSGMTLSTDGSASWTLVSLPGSQVVDKYELKLARKSSGNWNTNYKTVKTSDNSYEFGFSSTGQYYYVVRAIYVGGDISTWSSASPTVSITSDDVTHDERDDNNTGVVYLPVTGANGQVYYVPAGPGSGYSAGTSTIGIGGNYIRTSNNSTVSSAVIGNGPAGMPSVTTSTATSGWIREGNKWRYRYANNTYARDSWDYINNKWYYFDQNGYMTTGWVYYNSNWYLCGSDGERKTGWNMVNNKWYYMNEGGIMQTGYIQVDGITYYTDQSGARFTGGYNPDGHYFDESGVMIK